MIGLRERLARRRRELARGPLIALLRSCAAHAMLPWAGQDLTRELLQTCESAIGRALGDLADSGALRFFGIASAADLGSPAVEVFVISDGRPPYGRVDIEVGPLISWIFSGGLRGQGWTSPSELTMSDLGY